MNIVWFKPAPFRISLIVLIPFLLYWPALHYGFFWDDHVLITHNALMGSLRGLGEIWRNPFALPYAYVPAVLTSFWFEHALWGLAPFGYHFINLLFHSVNAALLFLILSRLSVPGALFAALIFVCHPVQAESVIWISERKNLLSFFFYALAVISYLRFSLPDRSTRQAGNGNPWLWYGLSLGFFLGSITAKSLACLLPVTLLLLVWWKKDRIGIKDLLPLLPFFLLSLGIGLFSIFMETHHLGANGLKFPLSFSERWLIAGRALMFYLERFFWPAHLTFLTPKWPIHIRHAAHLALFMGGCLALVIGCPKKYRKGIFVGLSFFLIHLIPLLGFLNTGLMQYSFVANWWLYYPSAGLAALAGSVCDRIRFGRAALIGIVLLTLFQVTSRRVPQFRDEEEMLRRLVSDYPNVPFAHYDLAMTYYERGKLDEAEDHLKKALELKPDYAEAHNSLAAVFLRERRFPEARAHLMEALRIKPDYAAAHRNLAIAYTYLGERDRAEVQFVEALRLNPYGAQLRRNAELFRAARAVAKQ